jgi:hypothetical protein
MEYEQKTVYTLAHSYTYTTPPHAGMKNYHGHRNHFIDNIVVQPDAQPNVFPFCFAEEAYYKAGEHDDDAGTGTGDHGINDEYRNNTVCLI